MHYHKSIGKDDMQEVCIQISYQEEASHHQEGKEIVLRKSTSILGNREIKDIIASDLAVISLILCP